MAVTTIPVDVGSAPGDGTGDPARTGGQSINTSVANLDAAVELLQSAGWDIQNVTATVSIGDQLISSNQAGDITLTLPAANAPVADDYNHVYIFNNDRNGNDILIDPDGTEELRLNGSLLGAGVAHTLATGYGALLVQAGLGEWHLFEVATHQISINEVADVTITAVADGEVLQYDNGTSKWINQTKEEADIVDRLTPALETTPYLKHETRAARSSGTETITCEDDPSVYLPIGGNNVTINLDVPALSLPVRGLDDVKLCGKVFVKMNGNYTGLTVTTDAGTKLGTFPKGTAPSTTNEYAVLVWEWFDDGTTDFMWAEWVNDA